MIYADAHEKKDLKLQSQTEDNPFRNMSEAADDIIIFSNDFNYNQKSDVNSDINIEERRYLNYIMQILDNTDFTIFEQNGFERLRHSLQIALQPIGGQDKLNTYITEKYFDGKTGYDLIVAKRESSKEIEEKLISDNSTDFMKYFIWKLSNLSHTDSLKDIEFMSINSEDYLEKSELIVRINDLYAAKNENTKKLEEINEQIADLQKKQAALLTERDNINHEINNC